MDVKEIFAKKLTALRKVRGLTQLQLAEKLNYSDKAVSKWERGEAVPDVSALLNIAELFGVSVDSLVKEEIVAAPKKARKKNKAIISLLTFFAMLVAECVTYVIMQGANPSAMNLAYCFVLPLPAFAIVATVFTGLWFETPLRFSAVTAIVWTLLLDAFLIVFYATEQFYWLIFIIGLPAQFVVLLSFKIIKIK